MIHALLQEQTRQIQEQNQLIQKQAEEIAALKNTVQEQKDEINHLKNMPKRPKFRPGGGDPKNRSGKPGNGKEKGGLSSNNDSERDIRGVAKRRNISGSTKSEEGKAFRDGLTTLKQTCARLGISFIGYLRSWFMRQSVNLADIVRNKYRMTAAGLSA